MQHVAEPETRRSQLILVAWLDVPERRQLRHDPFLEALARLLGNLARRLSCNCPILFLAGTRHFFPLTICSRMVSFILKQKTTLLFIYSAYSELHCNFEKLQGKPASSTETELDIRKLHCVLKDRSPVGLTFVLVDRSQDL